MSAPRTVLVVEDDSAFAEFLCAAIESLGHRAVHVGSGADAFEVFEKERPDLIFLDLLLPKKDGFKVAEEIRTHVAGKDVPIAMMTGIYRKAAYEKEGREKLRAAEYLLKPFGVREIWRVIERHLGTTETRAAEQQPMSGARGTSLDESPLACQLAAHLASGSEGVLFVRSAEDTFVLYLRDGGPVFARSSNACDRLERVLIKCGRVTEEQIASVMRSCAESRGRTRLGEALVERGMLTREDLTTSLQLQLRLILNRAFQVETGTCLFVSGEHPTEEDVLLAANPREVTLRGARMTSVDAARRVLPAPTSILSRPAGWEALLSGLNLRDDETRLLQMADGATSVERFLAAATVAGLDGPRILLGLTCAGLVSVTPMPAAAARSAAPHQPWDEAPWRQRPIGAVLADLHRKEATGRLVVLPDVDVRVTLYFRRGELTWVESPAPEHRLGPMILTMELLDATTLEAVQAEVGAEAPDTALARALVDRGSVGPAELFWAAVYQALGAAHALLELGVLEFEWTDGDDTPAVTLPDVPTLELAWNGLRELEDGVVQELLPPAGTLLMPGPRDASQLPATDAERAVIARLAGGLDVAELRAGDDPDARRTALGLAWLGMAACVDATRTADPATGEADISSVAGDFLEMLQDDAFLGEEDISLSSDAQFLDQRSTSDDEEPIDESSGALARLIGPDPTETGSSVDAEELINSVTALVCRLNELRPTVRVLRGGLDGNEPRVLVDRARMANLFDRLLEAIASTSQLEELLERCQAEQARRESSPEPASSSKP